MQREALKYLCALTYGFPIGNLYQGYYPDYRKIIQVDKNHNVIYNSEKLEQTECSAIKE